MRYRETRANRSTDSRAARSKMGEGGSREPSIKFQIAEFRFSERTSNIKSPSTSEPGRSLARLSISRRVGPNQFIRHRAPPRPGFTIAHDIQEKLLERRR